MLRSPAAELGGRARALGPGVALLRPRGARPRARARLAHPQGFAPFVDACLEQSEPSHARRYVERLTSAHERVGYLMRMGLPQEAREVAVQAKDAELLERIARNMI